MAAEEVRFTEPPEQKVVGPPAETEGTEGRAFTITTSAADVFVATVTVYEPEALTVMVCVVAPVDHVFPVAEDEVRFTDPPEQKVVGPLTVIVGVEVELTVTTVAAEVR